MATWQLDLQIVPRDRAQELQAHGKIPGNHDDIDWWKDSGLPADYEKRLSRFLPWTKPWADDWSVFGEEDGNRVDVILALGSIEEVRARIDVREVDFAFLDSLVGFVQDADCLFLTSAGSIVEPTIEQVCIEIETSTSANYVADPERFLRNLNRWRHKS